MTVPLHVQKMIGLIEINVYRIGYRCYYFSFRIKSYTPYYFRYYYEYIRYVNNFCYCII